MFYTKLIIEVILFSVNSKSLLSVTTNCDVRSGVLMSLSEEHTAWNYIYKGISFTTAVRGLKQNEKRRWR